MNYAGIEKAKLEYWHLNNLSPEAIEQQLINEGIPHDYIQEYLKAYQKLKIAKRQNTAFVLLLIGAFLGFLSFLLAVTNVAPAFHTFNLYGITSIAGIIIFIGLYLLFE